MSDDRLSPAIEVDGFIRRAGQGGGFGAVVRKGDAARGSIIIQIVDRGAHVAFLERQLGSSGQYAWHRVGPKAGGEAQQLKEWAEKRVKFDEDVWLIELDIPHPERFIVELGVIG